MSSTRTAGETDQPAPTGSGEIDGGVVDALIVPFAY